MQIKLNNCQAYKLILSAALITLLAACATKPPVNPNDGRYSINQDRAPTQGIDLAAIPDVVPEPVDRTLAGNRSPYSVLGKSYTVMPTEEGYAEQGVASWYGEKFHGHATSNGEIFDMYKVSAAHKSLPIPSFLKVTNLDNNRSIVVRVNDRGPFHGERVVDLSYAAALKLGYADKGTARVYLESIMPPAYGSESASLASSSTNSAQALSLQGSGQKYLQVGAFSEKRSAQQMIVQIQQITSFPVFIQEVVNDASQRLHRVRVGPISDDREIKNITDRVVAANLGRPYTITE